MDASDLYGLIELALVFGLVLALAVWQLVSVRREIARDRRKAAAEKPSATSGAP